jgi:hypothetical protein
MERLITDNTIQYLGKFAQLQMKLNLDDATDFAIETANSVLDIGKIFDFSKLSNGINSIKMWSKNGADGESDIEYRYYKIGMLVLGYNNIVLTFIKRYKTKKDYVSAIIELHNSNEHVNYSMNN